MVPTMPPPTADPRDADRAVIPTPTRSPSRGAGRALRLSGILYLDRICMSAALDSIQADLRLTNTEASYVLMAFTLAYGLFEVPTGRWGDRIGGRSVLTRIAPLVVGVHGDSPGRARACGRSSPCGSSSARARRGPSRTWPGSCRAGSRMRSAAGAGLLLAASSIGGAIAPFLAAVLIQGIGWRWTFAIFGGVGAAWAAGFWRWFRDDPATHPAVGPAELAHIGRRATSSDVHSAIPWAAVARSRSIYSLGLIMALSSFNSYIYFSWYPEVSQGRATASPRPRPA